VDVDILGDMLNVFSPGLSGMLFTFGGFPLSGWIAEGRLGGFFLPFDVGVKFGFRPVVSGSGSLEMDYLLVGGDVRYALLRGGAVLPAISVGVGFSHLSAGIGMGIGNTAFEFDSPTGTHTLRVNDPRLGVNWSTTTLDFKAQISKSLLVVTPYLGVGASHGRSRVSYGVNATLETSDISMDETREILKLYGINVDETGGFSSEVGVNGWSFRAFGGLSLNLLVLRLDFTLLYNARSGNFGATLGARIQI